MDVVATMSDEIMNVCRDMNMTPEQYFLEFDAYENRQYEDWEI